MQPERRMPSICICVIVTGLFVSACALALPKIVNHPPPDLTVHTDWLEEAGCTQSEPGSRFWDCAPTGPLGKLGCERIQAVDLLGGFSPSDPVVECLNITGELLDMSKFREEGCLFQVLITHVMFKDNAYQLLSGAADLESAFAPVESADEALSYALVATDLYARYGQEVDADYRYLVDKLEDTHVDETAEGYLVHLSRQVEPCGCGVHPVHAVDVLVTREGQIKETRSQPVLELKDKSCWD